MCSKSLVFPAFRARRGFTLVELMVVIVIIVVLAALAFVVSKKAIERAQQAKAVSALKQVGSGCLAYSQENFNNINTLRWVGDPKESQPYVGNSFWGRLQPYLFGGATSTNQGTLKKQINMTLDQIFSTPDADTMKKTVISDSAIYHDGSGLPVPVAFNRNTYIWNQDVKMTEFRDPGNVLYMVYGFGIFDPDDAKEFVERPKDGSKPLNNIYYLDNGSAIAAFLDGRVETVRPPIDQRRFGVLK